MNAADQMIRRVVVQAVDLLDRGGGGRATTVTLIATSGGHLTEAGLQREFETMAAGTPLEGAHLHFRW